MRYQISIFFISNLQHVRAYFHVLVCVRVQVYSLVCIQAHINIHFIIDVDTRVDMKLRFQFFAKYDYRFLLDVIIATFFAKAIIAISRLSLSISFE
jgi:hypothetical protein